MRIAFTNFPFSFFVPSRARVCRKFWFVRIFAAAVLFSFGPSRNTLELMKGARTMIGPMSASMPGKGEDAAVVELGRKLFLDPRLSADNTIACNKCHNVLASGSGTDNLQVSIGIGGAQGTRNAPTVLNAGFHIAQFWDGRAATLEDQAKGPMMNHLEMGMKDAHAVEEKLNGIKEYQDAFRAVYGQPASIDQIASAIAAFERTLVTHDRFDDFMNGNPEALTREEVKGLSLFFETGCISCHNGPLIGGQMYRRIGVVNPYENVTDTGRFALTGKPEDRYVFKVASLRNVALTPPYFHDGGAKTLHDAVKKMVWMQLGKTLSDLDVDYIVKFLNALSDKERGTAP